MSIVLFSCHLLQALHSLDVEKKRAAAAEEERNRAAAAAAAEAQRQRDAEAAAAKKAQEEAAAAQKKVRVTGCYFVISPRASVFQHMFLRLPLLLEWQASPTSLQRRGMATFHLFQTISQPTRAAFTRKMACKTLQPLTWF